MIRLDRRFWLLLALIWAAAAFCYWWVARGDLTTLDFPDPDDELRLVQVRDFLAGQSWFDVHQYRLNPPDGAPMHWSRLVDLPIAAIMLVARPLVGFAQAETVALVAVPLLTLAAAMAAAALLTARLADRRTALLAAALAPLTAGALAQMRVLRIDHHGWQIVLTLLAVWALLGRDPRRAGIGAGIATALLMQISLEGLPMTAAIGGVLALRWLLNPAAEAPRFAGFAAALGIGSLALFALTRPLSAWSQTMCDAVSPVHLAILGMAGIGSAAAAIATTRQAIGWRIAALAATAAACLALYAIGAPECLTGAFSALDPVVTEFWYQRIREGLPLSLDQPITLAAMLGFPIIGLIGCGVAHRTQGGGHREAWLTYLALLSAATAIGAMVSRAGGTATMLALPGGAVMAIALIGLVRAHVRASGLRVLATSAVVLAILPVTPALTVAFSGAGNQAGGRRTESRCATHAQYRALRRLPPATLLTNLDIAPGILDETTHRVLASGHHRNHAAIRDTILVFASRPDRARQILSARRIDYIAYCADLTEIQAYEQQAPAGLAARLAAGDRFAWLTPIAMPKGGLTVWRVARPVDGSAPLP